MYRFDRGVSISRAVWEIFQLLASSLARMKSLSAISRNSRSVLTPPAAGRPASRASEKGAGKSFASIVSFSVRISNRSTVFLSSRTLPFQAKSVRMARASGLKVLALKLFSSAKARAK
ncbi:MAG TPA: hypothetical protein VMS75_12485 [Terriglobales bacterium]|nr:hypothetical protein [Terriglobales bacterium]